jgi:serine/threonine-protein kinase
MIDGRGQARITDFGLAVPATVEGSPADAAGTLAYMAPERFRGTPATVQSDLYGLGLILYETYTGKPPFKASSVREWERAHSDSTPTSPTALAADVEPAVERAILRCLEKDPAKRPASAAQVAAALPGGDPLAAALAAGETPSPELVAASGEEGTLPRAKAWLWLAACLVALAVAPFAFLSISLQESVTFNLSPDALQARAHQVLQRLGYSDQPRDHGWWFRTDDEHLARLGRLRPSDAAAEIRAARPGPYRFCYRQAPAALVPTSVWRFNGISVVGNLTATDPPPIVGDVYLELDLDGSLVGLRVVPPPYGDAQPRSRVDWMALFDAAQLGPPDAFLEAAPKWWPEAGADAREAREGLDQGQRVRVEAAARAGRPIFFRVLPTWAVPSPNIWTASSDPHPVPALTEIVSWVSLVILAMLARRNLRQRRGDRTGAVSVAVAAMSAQVVGNSLAVHLTVGVVVGIVPQALFLGLLAWLAYIGLEPAVRRTWPHLLIASTRLIDGRWRDPLVGRSLLAGVLVGLPCGMPWGQLVTHLLGLPGGEQWVSSPESLGSIGDFTGNLVHISATSLVLTLVALGLLLVARLVGRRANAAWVIFTLINVGWNYAAVRASQPAGIASGPVVVEAAVSGLLFVWVLWKRGALAAVVTWWVGALGWWAPWTLDLSRWYAWRQFVVVGIIVALAFWGFRNVLGKQSAFPAGALDG